MRMSAAFFIFLVVPLIGRFGGRFGYRFSGTAVISAIADDTDYAHSNQSKPQYQVHRPVIAGFCTLGHKISQYCQYTNRKLKY